MKRILILLFTLSGLSQTGWTQCDPQQNIFENFDVAPNPDDRTILPNCWSDSPNDGHAAGAVQVYQGHLLVNSTYGSIIYSPPVENANGTISLKARVGYANGADLELLVIGNGTHSITTWRMTPTEQTFTYDLSAFSTDVGSAPSLALRFGAGTGCCINMEIDDFEYKSFCQPDSDPTIAAKDITVKLNSEGSVFVNGSSLDDGSIDSCGEPITNFSLSKSVFTCDDLGDNQVVLTATDSEGQSVTANATITVEPNMVINQSSFMLDAEGKITFDETHMTGSTICDAVSYNITPEFYDCTVSETWQTVTVTAAYDAGTATYERSVFIADRYDPIAVAQNVAITIDEGSGIAEITPEMIDGGSSDNCSIESMTLSKSVFSCEDVGENEVILTVTDPYGSFATSTVVVTVNSFLDEITLSSEDTNLCFDGETDVESTILTSSSEIGVDYTLYKKSDDSIIDGPISGTGEALSFNLGTISENTSYYLGAEVPASGGALNMPNAGVHMVLDNPATFDYSQGYTFSAWFKVPSGGITNRYHALFFAGTSSASDIEVYIQSTTGRLTVVHNRGTANNYYVTSGSVLPNNEYAHLAITYSGGSSYIYLNGELHHNGTLPVPNTTSGSKLAFGHILNTAWQAIAAEDNSEIMDDLRVYDKALTAEEIQADYYRPLQGSEDNLVLYFPLDETNAGVATDDLVNGVTAEISGSGSISSDFAVSTSFNCARIMQNEITIGDGIAPTIMAQDVTLQIDQTGQAQLTYEMLDNGSSDNCTDDLAFALSQAVFDCTDVGDNMVTLTATDEAGNEASATVTVTVVSPLVDHAVSTTSETVCPGNPEGTDISTDGSVEGMNYYLRNSNDDSIVDGPIVGTGAGLTFNSGAISQTTTFNVYAETSPDVNYALDFDGLDDYISAPISSSFDYANGFTMEAWVKAPLPGSNGGYLPVFFLGTEAASDVEVYIQQTTNQVVVVYNRGKAGLGGYNFTIPPDNEWFHLAVAYDGTDTKVYFDGVEQTINTDTNPGAVSKSTEAELEIGYISNVNFNIAWGSKNFQGQLDDVRIWSTVRTSDEIIANKDVSLEGTESGLEAYYKFDEGDGLTAPDLVSGNDGDMINMDVSDWVSGTELGYGVPCDLQMSSQVTITPEDTEEPTVATRDFVLVLGNETSGSFSAADIDDGSFDNCTAGEDLSLSLDRNTFDNSELGQHTVTLTVTDESGNSAAGTATVTVTDKQAQTITFDIIENKIYGDDSFGLTASSSSNLDIAFTSSDDEIVSISGTTAAIVGTGSVTITATQSGDETYAEAQEQRSFTIAKAGLTATAANHSIVYGDPIPSLTFTYEGFVNGDSSSDLTSEPTLATSATSSSNAGTYDIVLNGGSAVNYDISLVNAVLTIAKADPVISIEAIAEKRIDDADFDVMASTSSGETLLYTVSGPAMINGTTISLTGTEGTVTIEVSEAESTNYNAASESISFDVYNPSQTISFDELAAKTFGDTDFALSATASSGLTVSFISSNTDVAVVQGDIVSIVGAGSTVITASQNGDSRFDAAADIQQTLLVNKADQSIAFDALSDMLLDDADFDLNATASSGLIVTYTSSNSDVATVNGSTVSIVGVGTTVITASQSGSDNYNAAVNVEQSLTITEEIIASAQTDLEAGWIFYPNPARDYINIESTLGYSLNTKVRLLDLLGRVVIEKELSQRESQSSQIDLRGIRSGQYLLVLTNDEQREISHINIYH